MALHVKPSALFQHAIKILNLRYNFCMIKETILQELKSLKNHYLPEGFVIEAKPSFVERYGIRSIARIEEIKKEISTILGISVDLQTKQAWEKPLKNSLSIELFMSKKLLARFI